MRKTSFGQMDVILKKDRKIIAEYLEFETQGRSHQHPEFESFFVLSGSGEVFSGEHSFNVEPGDLVTIPPNTPHWMTPAEGAKMTGLLWYHPIHGKHFSPKEPI